MSRKILAFYSPYPGAGKTTAAVYLLDRYGYQIRSFAGALRHVAKELLIYMGRDDWDNLLYKGKDSPIEELDGATGRDLLIEFGAAGRGIYQNIWVDCTKRALQRSPYGLYVIDDLRFPNEHTMLRKMGAKIVRVTNPRRSIDIETNSETESLLEGRRFDAEIENDMERGLEQYHAQLDALIATLWPEE